MSEDEIKYTVVHRAALLPPPAAPPRIQARHATTQEVLAERQARRIERNQSKRAFDPVYRKAVAWARMRQQLGNEKSQAAKLGISEGRLRRMIWQAKRWGEL